MDHLFCLDNRVVGGAPDRIAHLPDHAQSTADFEGSLDGFDELANVRWSHHDDAILFLVPKREAGMVQTFFQISGTGPTLLGRNGEGDPRALVRWHRGGFRGYRRWKSRPLGGRPQIDT